MIKIATIVGARPQFIKAAPISRAIAEHENVREVLIHTGQHYDENMSDVFFRELEIRSPDYNLGVGSGSHGSQTGQMLQAIESVLIGETPDWVLIYGDTNSTLAGALAAAKLVLPIAHVEAGLRSFNRAMPEEVNRVVADHLSSVLFAPTVGAVGNLLNEGIPRSAIVDSGDVMYDSALFYATLAERRSSVLSELRIGPKSYCLVTIHRPANTDDPQRLARIVESLNLLGGELPVLWPLHPRTRAAMEKCDLRVSADRVKIIDPVGYLDMVMLEKSARVILTDSGGVQKEAFFFCVPCITLRNETEWKELVDRGFNRLCGPSPQAILSSYREALAVTPDWSVQLYGNGNAAQIVADRLLQS